MWTIAAANKKIKGPLGSYNSLTDVHLSHFFSTPAKWCHLKDAKLITEEGVIIPEQKVKVHCLQHEKKKKFYDLLAKNVIQSAAYKKCFWNKKLFNYLEDISKMENVENIKVGYSKPEKNKILSMCKKNSAITPVHYSAVNDWTETRLTKRNASLFPRSAPSSSEFFSKNNDVNFQTNSSKQKRCYSAKDTSPYVIPLFLCNASKNHTFLHKQKRRKQKKISTKLSHTSELKTNNEVSKLSKSHHNSNSCQCKITILYHGHGLFNTFLGNRREEIIIKQQHSGGTVVTVYKGEIVKNETATFISLDKEGFNFSITIFLDGIRYLKLSSCCVFRYSIGRRLGGPNGHFSIQSVEGGKPCLKCQYREIESCSNYFTKNSIRTENEKLKESTIVLTQKIVEKEKPAIENNKEEDDSDNTSISDREDFQQSEVSIRSDEEIEENLLAKFDLQDTESNDQILKEHNLQHINSNGELNYESEESIEESIHDIIKDAAPSFQSESSLEDENGKQHVILASIHGSPS